MRVGHRGDHPGGHRPGGHPQLGVHAGHHHVEPAEQVVALVQGAVLEDVHLDAGQDAERGQLGVERGDQSSCSSQALGGQPVGHGQPGRVVGQRDPLVAEVPGRLGHLPRRAAAVGPVRVGVAVAAQRGPQAPAPWPAPRRAARPGSRAAGRPPPGRSTSAVVVPIPGSAQRALRPCAGPARRPAGRRPPRRPGGTPAPGRSAPRPARAGTRSAAAPGLAPQAPPYPHSYQAMACPRLSDPLHRLQAWTGRSSLWPSR